MSFAKIKSKYYLVKAVQTNEGIRYFAKINKQENETFESERKAAIEVDKWLIQQGKEPKNVLVKQNR